jgi:predicted ATPase
LQDAEGDMNKISKVAIHNVFKPNETAIINIDSPVTIFTGYNGVGKSTALAVIHSTVSLYGDFEYSFPRSNWGSQVYLENGVVLNHVKMARPVDKDFTLPSLKKTSDKVDAIKIFYDELLARAVPDSKLKKMLVSKEGEKRDTRSTNILSIEIGSKSKSKSKRDIGADVQGPGIQSVLYCDELFNFNAVVDESENIDDLDIFSKKNTLDKTLYFLLLEFSSLDMKAAASPHVALIVQNVRDLFTDKEMPEDLKRQISEFEKIQRAGAHGAFLNEANLFFEMTNREAFVGENGFLSLRLKSDMSEVKWFNLSKGEKTLLCLLLAVFLNKDKNTLFLLDEPDLSLHIKWQKQLLKSLFSLAPNSQFVVSTHSPAMVGNVAGEKVLNIGLFSKA